MKTESIVMIVFTITVIACFSLRFTQNKKVNYIEIKVDSTNCIDTTIII